MGSEKITIEALVNAAPETAWNRWTDPAHIMQWNFASDDWCCPSAENDLQVGGRYKARMEAKDGSFGFDFEAIYDEIIAHKKLAFTLTDGRKVVTTFEAQGDATKVTTVFDPDRDNPLDMQRDGWQAILNNFKAHAEAG